MNRIVSAIAGVVTVIALGAVFATPAVAHLFLFTGPLPALLLFLGKGFQVFSPEPGGIQILCKSVKLHGLGPSKAMQASTVLVKGRYEACEAAGFPATVSAVEYEFSAEEALANLKHITIAIPAVGCSILFLQKNNVTVGYLRFPTEVEAHVAGTNVHRLIIGGGGLCGPEGLLNAGIYTGLFLYSADGGTVQWD